MTNLDQAFIHRSFLNENKSSSLQSNERLEFLGDAVLELITSSYLYSHFPNKPEGELTSLRSALVKTENLSAVARTLDLGKKLKMSKGEAQSGGRDNPALLANTVEALIGAIYLDQGLPAAQKFVSDHILSGLKQILTQNLYLDYKSTLQEKVQAKNLPTPTYITVSAVGPDHHKTFTVAVQVNGQTLATGLGPSKQKAESSAAKLALEKINQT